MFVGDRGMVTSDNLERWRSRGHGYLVGLNRRRLAEILRYIEAATGPWIDCPVGITAREKAAPPKTQVQEVAADHAGIRIFVVRSDERERYERAQRLNAMARVKAKLEALQRRVDQGKLKASDKIGAAAARILAGHHGHRYYAWELKDGRFHQWNRGGWFLHDPRTPPAVPVRRLVGSLRHHAPPADARRPWPDSVTADVGFP